MKRLSYLHVGLLCAAGVAQWVRGDIENLAHGLSLITTEEKKQEQERQQKIDKYEMMSNIGALTDQIFSAALTLNNPIFDTIWKNSEIYKFMEEIKKENPDLHAQLLSDLLPKETFLKTKFKDILKILKNENYNQKKIEEQTDILKEKVFPILQDYQKSAQEQQEKIKKLEEGFIASLNANTVVENMLLMMRKTQTLAESAWGQATPNTMLKQFEFNNKPLHAKLIENKQYRALKNLIENNLKTIDELEAEAKTKEKDTSALLAVKKALGLIK